MKATETKVQKIIEGTTQYFVPHYQRPYSWGRKEWNLLWQDIEDLCERLQQADENALQPTHFMGSIVTMQGFSVPQGVNKYVLIDGQQRLTTLIIFLAALRDRAEKDGLPRIAEKIHNLYLTNQYQDGDEHYKLLPTVGQDPDKGDRAAFLQVLQRNNAALPMEHPIMKAYAFFDGCLVRDKSPSKEALLQAVTDGLVLVSIVLDRDDNPYAIFESLNAKGRPLSQADLIRNYFFMSIPQSQHDDVYRKLWQPMERILTSEHTTEFIRQYLIMLGGSHVKSDSVYFELKDRIEKSARSGRKAIDYLRELHRVAGYYAKLIVPGTEPDSGLSERLARLRRLDVGVASPLLLNLYDAFDSQALSKTDLCEILDVIENFVIRRFICGIPTHGLSRIFAAMFRQISSRSEKSLVSAARDYLAARGYPTDPEFRERFQTVRLYGPGERGGKAKFILDRLEASYAHKERVDLSKLTIEHVLPQAPSQAWFDALGPELETLLDTHLHTVGNLTLTGYNPEMSNGSFASKKRHYEESHVTLNKYFGSVSVWNRVEIEKRSASLADLALCIWSNFGPKASGEFSPLRGVTNTKPVSFSMFGVKHDVRDWRDVLRLTMEMLCDLGEERFAKVEEEFPRHIHRAPTHLRDPKPLPNGCFYETNLSAEMIFKICRHGVEVAEIPPEAWLVEYR